MSTTMVTFFRSDFMKNYLSEIKNCTYFDYSFKEYLKICSNTGGAFGSLFRYSVA